MSSRPLAPGTSILAILLVVCGCRSVTDEAPDPLTGQAELAGAAGAIEASRDATCAVRQASGDPTKPVPWKTGAVTSSS